METRCPGLWITEARVFCMGENAGADQIESGEIKLNDLKELGKQMKEHPIIIVTTLVAAVAGAILGVVAYYHGWLG